MGTNATTAVCYAVEDVEVALDALRSIDDVEAHRPNPYVSHVIARTTTVEIDALTNALTAAGVTPTLLTSSTTTS